MSVRSDVIMLDRERRVRFDAFALSEFERVYGKDMLHAVREIQKILERGQSAAAQKAASGEELTGEEIDAVELPFRLILCLAYAGVARSLPDGTSLADFSDMIDKMEGENPVSKITAIMPTILAAFFKAMAKNEDAPEGRGEMEPAEAMNGTGKTSSESGSASVST